MHGAIFVQLQKYVTQKMGPGAWNELLIKAGIPINKLFLPLEQYPVNDIIRLLFGATQITLKPQKIILEDFGEFLGAYLMETYGQFVNPRWKTLDVLEKGDSQIYQVLKFQEDNALPAILMAERESATQVSLIYSSPRKMCSVGVGVIKGIARHFGEKIALNQPRCMLKGDSCCKISVELIKGA